MAIIVANYVVGRENVERSIVNGRFKTIVRLQVIKARKDMSTHMLNTMTMNVSTNSSDLWYVGLRACNLTTSHGKWFGDVKKLDRLGYVKTRDDTAHPIVHIGNKLWQDEVLV